MTILQEPTLLPKITHLSSRFSKVAICSFNCVIFPEIYESTSFPESPVLFSRNYKEMT